MVVNLASIYKPNNIVLTFIYLFKNFWITYCVKLSEKMYQTLGVHKNNRYNL